MRFVKDPDAALFYGFDWSEWLASGETISNSTWTVAAGITGTSPGYTTTSTSIKLSGGTDGSIYNVTNRITTSSGQVDERTLRIMVGQR